MDRTKQLRNKLTFKLKKWILIILCAVGIATSIILPVLTRNQIIHYGYNEKSSRHSHSKTKQIIKELPKIVEYLAAALSIIFYFVGLVGAYKEHYCSAVLHIVLTVLGLIGSIAIASATTVYWVSAVNHLVVLILAFAFAYDLSQLRMIALSQPGYITNPTPAPQMSVLHVPPVLSLIPPQSQFESSQSGWSYIPPSYNQNKQINY